MHYVRKTDLTRSIRHNIKKKKWVIVSSITETRENAS